MTMTRVSELVPWRELPVQYRSRINRWIYWIALVTVVFARPLAQLVVHSIQHDLHSHIPLVPVAVIYLFAIQPRPALDSGRSIGGAIAVAVLGVGAVVAALTLGARLSLNDYLALMTVGYVSFVAAGGFVFLGARWMRAAAFPVMFLLFMVPLPDAAVNWVEQMLMLLSADVAAWFFAATGTPVVRDGTIFRLPTIILEVARECSGIRSTWVLFITSLAASHMFLTSTWRRLILVAFVIPLGIVRNGFRILVIGLLCVHVGPHMIDSFIHHHGGPIFFALSLVPLFLLLASLRRTERRP